MRIAVLTLAALLILSNSVFAQAQVRSALERKLPSIKLKDVAMTDAIDFFRDTTNVNLVVDWKGLEEVGISKETPVSLDLRNVPVRVALRNLLESAAPGLLTFYIDENVLHIASRPKADDKMITRIYPVQDLLVDIPNFTTLPNVSVDTGTGGNTRGEGGSGGFSGASSGSGGGNDLFGNNDNSNNNETRKTGKERAQELIDLIQTTIRPEVWDINGGKARIKFFNGNLVITAPRAVHEAIGGPIE